MHHPFEVSFSCIGRRTEQLSQGVRSESEEAIVEFACVLYSDRVELLRYVISAYRLIRLWASEPKLFPVHPGKQAIVLETAE